MKLILLFALVAVAFAGPQTYSVGYPKDRVVGGDEATPHSAPYIVSLQYTELWIFTSHFCGGSIVSDSVILTAAHCIVYAINRIEVLAGAHSIKNKEASWQRVYGKQAIVHPDYVKNKVGPYDIALIITDTPLLFNEFVQPIPLPNSKVIPEGSVTLYGWGSTSTSNTASMPKTLRTVTKPIVPYDECKALMPTQPLEESNVCTGPLTGGVSGCSGDSGGPLVQTNNKGVTEIIGLTSWGFIPCGGVDRPTVYTRISAYTDWVKEKASLV